MSTPITYFDMAANEQVCWDEIHTGKIPGPGLLAPKNLGNAGKSKRKGALDDDAGSYQANARRILEDGG